MISRGRPGYARSGWGVGSGPARQGVNQTVGFMSSFPPLTC